MKMTNSKRVLSLILCIVLTWTAALITGCSDNKTAENPQSGTTDAAAAPVATAEATTADDTEAEAEVTELGDGETSFTFTVTDKNGGETKFNIKTDKTNVGEALLDLGLIEGDEGPYGLYVKKVNGITADYDIDGTYWAFYVNGEYAMTGVEATDIETGKTYSFKVEK